jgi:hypothetical protein
MNPALNQTAGAGYRRPRDPAEIWLARQWQQVLGFPAGIGENFFGVGGNSLDAARVIDAIAAEFGLQLPLNVLTAHPTIEGLAALLRGHASQLAGPLITIQDGDGTRPPLFLVHPGSGQAAPYCPLASALGDQYAVTGIQAAGLYTDAEPRRTVPAMASAYAAAIRAARPAGPYLLGGAAIGAAIAYEIAARLGTVQLLTAIDERLLEPDPATAGTGQQPSDPDPDGWPGHDQAPPGTAPEYAARSRQVRHANQDAIRDWRPSPYTGPVDLLGPPPGTTLPATVTQRTHHCTTHERLARTLRQLIG